MTAKATNILTIDTKSDFYSHFFIHHPWAKWVFDVTTLAFLEVNQAAIDIYGYTRDEFLSMIINDIRTPDDVTALENHLAAVGQTYYNDRNWRHLKKMTCLFGLILFY